MKELWVLQRQAHEVEDFRLLLVDAADLVKTGVNVVWEDHVARDNVLVIVEHGLGAPRVDRPRRAREPLLRGARSV